MIRDSILHRRGNAERFVYPAEELGH
jgi:hypothetical protein